MDVTVCENTTNNTNPEPGNYYFIQPDEESGGWQFVRLQIHKDGSFGRLFLDLNHTHVRGQMRQALQRAKDLKVEKLVIIMKNQFVPDFDSLLFNVLGPEWTGGFDRGPVVPAALSAPIQELAAAA